MIPTVKDSISYLELECGFLGAVISSAGTQSFVRIPRETLIGAATYSSKSSFIAALAEAKSEYSRCDIGLALPRDFYPKQQPSPAIGTLEAEKALVDVLWDTSGRSRDFSFKMLSL